MKGIDFLDIVGEIDERYISEIQEKKVIRWNTKRVITFAASLLVVCVLSFVGYRALVPVTNEPMDVAELDMAEMGRGITDEPYTVDENEMNASEEHDLVGDNEEEDSQEEKNIVQKIFANIVSFFGNLRF